MDTKVANQRSKVAFYARVSTLLGQDTENQLVGLRNLAVARGYAVTGEYVDHGVSGAKERRPSLDKMIRDAQAGKFHILAVSALDRLGRDTRHILNLINELEHYGVLIISIREGIDFTSPIGRATLAIISAIAELERNLISERIRTALAVKKVTAEKTQNGWTCGRPRVATEDLSKRVSELRNFGKSIREISKILNVGKSTVSRITKAQSHKGGK